MIEYDLCSVIFANHPGENTEMPQRGQDGQIYLDLTNPGKILLPAGNCQEFRKR